MVNYFADILAVCVFLLISFLFPLLGLWYVGLESGVGGGKDEYGRGVRWKNIDGPAGIFQNIKCRIS